MRAIFPFPSVLHICHISIEGKRGWKQGSNSNINCFFSIFFGWQRDQDLPLSRDQDKMFVQSKLKANCINEFIALLGGVGFDLESRGEENESAVKQGMDLQMLLCFLKSPKIKCQ